MRWKHREPPVYIGATKDRGRGVFAGRDLRKGERYEGLVWLLPSKDLPILETLFDRRSGEPLSKYTYHWSRQILALSQGWAGMLNHSTTPNLEYTGNDRLRKTLIFRTLRNIKRGEELTFSYRDDTEF